ncbi:hypothetical protein AGDE_15925 [Angomonas deanei]|nr:hypothetical protein AGDE_15925 [Angomonas deanei]|eukprot:EPY18130.1 hypothetical protein AGDE_15925 [Angomonas deanei]
MECYLSYVLGGLREEVWSLYCRELVLDCFTLTHENVETLREAGLTEESFLKNVLPLLSSARVVIHVKTVLVQKTTTDLTPLLEMKYLRAVRLDLPKNNNNDKEDAGLTAVKDALRAKGVQIEEEKETSPQ